MKNIEESLEATKKWLNNNIGNLVKINKSENHFIIIDKKTVDHIQIVSREKKNCVRLWFLNGTYEDFPNHTKKQMEKLLK